MQVSELGEFLRGKRAALRPEDTGLMLGSALRRVPGLRREELAMLAGISVDYYVRLEQGRARNVSDTVLSSVADALQLDSDERTYLHNLAHPAPRRRSASRPQHVRPGMRRLLGAIPDVPAFVLGRRMDVLAWNDLAAVVTADFSSFPVGDRNIAKLIFLFDGGDRYPDFDNVTKDVVGNLRAEAGRHPDDPGMASLIGELSVRSETFRRLWAGHNVREKTYGIKVIRHPVVGEFTVSFETFRAPDDPDQALITYTVEPGSESETSLRLLASWVKDGAPDTLRAPRQGAR